MFQGKVVPPWEETWDEEDRSQLKAPPKDVSRLWERACESPFEEQLYLITRHTSNTEATILEWTTQQRTAVVWHILEDIELDIKKFNTLVEVIAKSR